MRLRNRVRELRKSLGLSRVALAEQIAMSPTTLSKVENETSPPSGAVMLRLAEALQRGFGNPSRDLFWTEDEVA